MTTVWIRHQRSTPFHTCADEEQTKICQVELTRTLHSVNARGGNRLVFFREGDEENTNYDVEINPTFGDGGPWTSTGQRLEIPIPEGQLRGYYKYKISYPNDTTAIVAPLDPIIIIQPRNALMVVGIVAAGAAVFAAGAATAMVLGWG